MTTTIRRGRPPAQIEATIRRAARDSVRLGDVLDRLPDGVFRYRITPRPGFEYVNRTLAERTGFTPEQYLSDGALLLAAVHPDDADLVGDLLTRGPGSEPLTVRLRPRDGGTSEWVELRGSPVLNDTGAPVGVVGVVRWIPAPEAEAPRAKVYGDLRIEFDRARVVVGGRPVGLTRSELRVLAILTEREGEVVTRREIVTDLWQSAHVGTAAAAEAHISTLRRKIERDPRNPEHIRTLRGRGYRFVGTPPRA